MDHLLTRIETLEQHVQTLAQHTRMATHRLRWWRGLACSLMVLGLLGWGLPLGLAREDGSDKEKDQKGLAHRVAALEKLLKHVSREGNEIFITGANLHIVNGLGQTACGTEEEPIPNCPNGLGNLIVGYNELRGELDFCQDSTDPFCTDTRTGSHNVVVGSWNNFSRFGGLVVSNGNTISGDFAVVSGGQANTASGRVSSVSGGFGNIASGLEAVVSGGAFNTASGGDDSSVSGGFGNTASGFIASVSGGAENTASGGDPDAGDVVFVGGAVSGGFRNTASGTSSVVSGGQNITQETQFGWSAGSEADEDVEGNFRSP